MGTLADSPIWPPAIQHFEANAVLTGGPDCPDNLPLQDLANRTAYLKQQSEAHAAATDPHPQYLNTAEGDAKIAAAVAALVNSSPAALDTLAELATALNNDANFATTITNALATKADKSAIVAQTYTAFTTAGAAPNFTLTPLPAIAAYVSGLRFSVKFHADGGASPTININALGVKNIKQYDYAGSKVAAFIKAGQLADVEYDGTDFIVLDPIVPSGKTTFTANGSFTAPPGVLIVYVSLAGGGGGGGGCGGIPADGSDLYSGAGGGGGSVYYRYPISVTPGQVVPVIIGAGGAGGASRTNGSSGGTSSFGSFLSASGGGGATYNAAGCFGGWSGLGSQKGGDGNPRMGTVLQTLGGCGGGCFFGGGGSPSYSNNPGGAGHGGGGAGGATGALGYSGGDGAGGLCIVEW